MLLRGYLVPSFLVAGLFGIAHSRETVLLEPPNVTDSIGNFADTDSQIIWAPIPPGESYITQVGEHMAGRLKGLEIGARGFVKTCFSKSLPWDVIVNAVSGDTITVNKELILKVLRYAVGFVASAVVGLLFIALFPIIGCCMCCCRCCGKCGGKMIHKQTPNSSIWKKCYMLILAISCVFLLFGVATTFVANENMRTLLDDVHETVRTNIEDFHLYTNNTVQEVEFIALDGFNFAADVIYRDLDNLAVLVGDAVQRDIDSQAGINEVFDQLILLEPTLMFLVATLKTLEESTEEIINISKQMNSSLIALSNNITATFDSCGACGSGPDLSNLKTNFNPSELPNFETELANLETVLANNITALVLEGKRQFNNISGIIDSKSKSTVAQVKDFIESFKDTIEESLTSVTDMISMFDKLDEVLAKLDLDEARVGSLSLSDIETYRWYGGLVLALLPTLVLMFQLCGLTFSFVGNASGDGDQFPTERSSVGNAGGLLLIISVVITFLVGALVMLYVWATFLIGAPLERFICTEIRDPDLTIFQEVLDGGPPEYGPYKTILGNITGYTLGELLLQDVTAELTFSGVVKACQENTGAFQALALHKFINLDQFTDYQSQLNITQTIEENLLVDLSDIELIDNATKQQITDMIENLAAIDYDGLNSSLAEPTSLVNFDGISQDLLTAANTIEAANATIAADLRAHEAELRRIESDEYESIQNTQTYILESIDTLKSQSIEISRQTTLLLQSLNLTERYLQNHGGTIVQTNALTYANRLLGVADQFVEFAIYQIENEVGRCGPIYTFFNSVLEQLVCGTLVGNLNTVWFSLGWCLCFMVLGTIFSIKLAKHARRMKELDPSLIPRLTNAAEPVANAVAGAAVGGVVATGPLVTRTGQGSNQIEGAPIQHLIKGGRTSNHQMTEEAFDAVEPSNPNFASNAAAQNVASPLAVNILASSPTQNYDTLREPDIRAASEVLKPALEPMLSERSVREVRETELNMVQLEKYDTAAHKAEANVTKAHEDDREGLLNDPKTWKLT